MEIVEKTVNVDGGVDETFIVKADAGDLCRLCANTDNQLIPIYRGEGLEHHISVKIEKHLPIIKVTEVDKLPLQICYQCASTLISWHNLYEGCLVADKRLREILAVDEKLCQEDDAFGDYVDDYRDNYDDDTHETLPTSTNTSNLETNTSKDNSTVIPVISDAKAFNETDLDGSDERYVASYETVSSNTDHESLQLPSKFELKLVGVSKSTASIVKRRFIPIAKPVPTIKLLGKKASPSKQVVTLSSLNTPLTKVVTSTKLETKTSELPKSTRQLASTKKLIPIAPKPNIISFAVHNQSVPLVAAISPLVIPSATTEISQRICKLSCDKCGRKFCRRSALNKHLRNASCLKTKKEWPCDACEQLLPSRDLLRAHLRDTHPEKFPDKDKSEKSIEDERHKCDVCPKTYKTRDNLTRHVRQSHRQSTFTARMPYATDPELVAFFKSHAELDDDGSVIFKCDSCKYMTRHRYRFYHHYQMHTNERPFVCDYCGKSFRTKWFIKRHIRCVHLGEKKFPCDICGQAFSARKFTENHKRRHTGERPFICEICGKTFIQSGTLLTHVKFHLNIRKHECEVCHQKFVRRGHMLLHLKRHNNIKDFVCDQCGKAFIDKKMLRNHQVIHSDERPFSCELCGATFKLRKHLVQHGRTHRAK